MRKRIVSSLVLLVIATLIVGAANAFASGEITLKVMRPGTPSTARAFLEPAIAAFMKENPNIKVEIVDLGWVEYFSRLAVMWATKTDPDVYMAWYPGIPQYADQKLVEPLDDLLDQDLKARIPEALWKAASWKGHIYGVPTAVAALALYWHKDVFAKAGFAPDVPPQTWDELKDYAIKISRNTKVWGLGMSGKADPFIYDQWAVIYHSNSGRGMLDDEGDPLFDGPDGVEALQYLVDLNKSKATQPNVIQYNRGDLRPLFRDGKIAMVYNDGPWFLPILEQTFDFSNKEKSPIGISTLPKGKKGNYSILGNDCWVVSAHTKHPKEAWKLLSFLVRPEWQYKHDVAYGTVPAQTGEYSMPEFKKWYWQPFIQQVQKGFSYPKTPDLTAIRDGEGGLNENIQRAIAGVLTPQEALSNAARLARKLKK
ncbi:MAG: sugar ABC transporter substrate-binding protein [Firmicutes bacterium]|nr:sugar ABC transporter substrate-binding protein [Bacillota bacterium]